MYCVCPQELAEKSTHPEELHKTIYCVLYCVCPQELAENGALILGERLRSVEERQVVADVIARVMNARVSAGT